MSRSKANATMTSPSRDAQSIPRAFRGEITKHAVTAPLGKPMSPVTGVACVVAAVILWGVQLPIATLAFARVDPYHLTGIRYGIALVVLVPLLLYCEGSCWPVYRSRFWAATSTGVAGTCISPMLTLVGHSY